MSNGDFLWCDLSALNAEDAKMFYGQLLGWTFEEIVQRDDARYHIASTGTGECAAIFEMPERFKKMDLPSFWMSYIQTDDIDDAIDRARRLRGKVEFGPEPFGDNALIALIRDPLGAGFTLYQGD